MNHLDLSTVILLIGKGPRLLVKKNIFTTRVTTKSQKLSHGTCPQVPPEDLGMAIHMDCLSISTVIRKVVYLVVEKDVSMIHAIYRCDLLRIRSRAEDLGMDLHLDLLSISTVTRTVVNLVVEKNVPLIHAIYRSHLLSGIRPLAEDLGMKAKMNCLGVRLANTLNGKAPGLRAFIIIQGCRSVDRQM